MEVLLRKFKTASSFSFSQWKVIGTAYFLLLKTRTLLFFKAPQVVEKVLLQGEAEIAVNKKILYPKKEFFKLFQIARRYQPGKLSCLPTSIAENAFLTHYGFPSRLHIGIQKNGGKLQAHTWCQSLEQNRFHPLDFLKS